VIKIACNNIVLEGEKKGTQCSVAKLGHRVIEGDECKDVVLYIRGRTQG
jgi:hypothetical protein